MKKITFILLFAILGLNAQTQFEFKKSDGTLVENGEIILFGPSANYFNFRLTNTSNQPLDIKFKCTNLVNTAGNAFQLCYGGTCYESVSVNGVYPDYENFLGAGQSNPSQGEYLANFLNPENGESIDLEFSVYAVGFENDVINFTYRFSPIMSSNSFEILENMGIKLKNTVVDSNLNFDSNTSGTLTVYNLTGQLVSNISFKEGSQNINLSNLTSSFYMVRFSTLDGRTSTSKVFKK